MLKIKDNVDLKELEKFGFMKWDKEGAKVIYFKFIPINSMIIQIFEDRIIDYQLPIFRIYDTKDINIEKFIQDLIEAKLVEKVSDK